jgi:hypothetical protein
MCRRTLSIAHETRQRDGIPFRPREFTNQMHVELVSRQRVVLRPEGDA